MQEREAGVISDKDSGFIMVCAWCPSNTWPAKQESQVWNYGICQHHLNEQLAAHRRHFLSGSIIYQNPQADLPRYLGIPKQTEK